MPDVAFRYKVVIHYVALILASVINLSWGASWKVMAGALAYLI